MEQERNSNTFSEQISYYLYRFLLPEPFTMLYLRRKTNNVISHSRHMRKIRYADWSLNHCTPIGQLSYWFTLEVMEIVNDWI